MKIIYLSQPLSSFIIGRDDGKTVVTSPVLGERRIACSDRFWRSLWKVFKIDDRLFSYFSSEEIFQRVSEKASDAVYRFAVEESATGGLRLLAVSSLGSSFVSGDDVLKEFDEEEVIDSGYHDGQIYAVLPLVQSGEKAAKSFRRARIAGPSRNPRYAPVDWESLGARAVVMASLPIDGLGNGTQSLGVEIGDGILIFRAGKLSTKLGGVAIDRDYYTHHRAVRTREGILSNSLEKAMHARLSAAKKSAASLAEIAKFFKVCDRFGVALERYDELLGHPFEGYGLPSYNAFSLTRLGQLPTRNSVLDLLATMAAASADVPPAGRWKLFDLAGKMLGSYFDFEELSYGKIVGEEPIEDVPEAMPVASAVGETKKTASGEKSPTLLSTTIDGMEGARSLDLTALPSRRKGSAARASGADSPTSPVAAPRLRLVK